MDTRDSGIIDLFAIHKEEEERFSAPSAMPSGPPPAVSFDTNVATGEDADVDALAFAQANSKKKAKIIGGAFGGLAVIGILIAAIAGGGGATKEPAATAAAAPPPPAATETLPAPAATPAPTQASEPAPPATAKSDDKGGYSRSAAIAAYKGNKKAAKSAPKAPAMKMQKVQSSGTN